MKKHIVVFASIFLAAIVCRADDESDTQKILSCTIDKGIAILKDKETSTDQKLDAYNKLLTENCHTELATMLALGKEGWVAITPEQRKDFVSAFLSVMTRSYFNKLSQIDVSHISVDYKENIKTGKTKRTIKTVMNNSREGFNVDYKFALRDGLWGIYDLEVEGISLIASYRSQFTDFMKTKSVVELLAELKNNSAKFDAEVVK